MGMIFWLCLGAAGKRYEKRSTGHTHHRCRASSPSARFVRRHCIAHLAPYGVLAAARVAGARQKKMQKITWQNSLLNKSFDIHATVFWLCATESAYEVDQAFCNPISILTIRYAAAGEQKRKLRRGYQHASTHIAGEIDNNKYGWQHAFLLLIPGPNCWKQQSAYFPQDVKVRTRHFVPHGDSPGAAIRPYAETWQIAVNRR